MKANEIAAAIHKRMCEDSRFGYSQAERWGASKETWTVGGQQFGVPVGDYDCSSSVIEAWRLAVSHTAYAGKLDAATYTGNISAVFCGSGLFERKPMSFLAQPGDLYLNEANHVAMCQTQVPDVLSEFSISETGGIYGKRGDQTGDEAHLRAYYDYPWDCIIHYKGGADRRESSSTGQASAKSPTTLDNSSATKGQPRYRAMVNARWLDEMAGLTDTGGSGEDFAGETGVGIQFLAVQGAGRYRACTQMGGWLDWVSGYDVNDLDKGCAGDGSAITKLEIPNAKVKYQVHSISHGWFAWMVGNHDTGGSSDTFAGDGTPIDMVRITLA